MWCFRFEPGVTRDMGDDPRRHVGETRDATEMLEGLEKNQKHQAWTGLARSLPREGEFSRLRREGREFGLSRIGRHARMG